jgi:S-formylglutathione hydrolase
MLRSLALCFLLATSALADTAAPRGEVRIIELASPAVAANLLGDPARQSFAIYLPPAYASEPSRRFPVLYLLHGIGGTYTDFTEVWDVRVAMARGVAPGEQFIVVMPNGRNALGGSFYLDSPVTGNWATHIAREIVGHVDANFRTLADRNHRGVAGHSMGGFGALNFAMTRPELFGSVYALSPCCLAQVDDLSYGNHVFARTIAFRGLDDVKTALRNRDFYPAALAAMAMAVTPNPGAPLLADLPFIVRDGELMPNGAVFRAWHDRLPLNRIAASGDALRSMRRIGLEYGIDDQFAHIPAATLMFSQELGRQRIPHVLNVFEGDHREHTADRLAEVVLPFFARAFRPE